MFLLLLAALTFQSRSLSNGSFWPGLGGTGLFLAALKRFALDGPPELLGESWGSHGTQGMETMGFWVDLGGPWGAWNLKKYGFGVFYCFVEVSLSDDFGVWGLQPCGTLWPS